MSWKASSPLLVSIGLVGLSCATPLQRTGDAPPEPTVTECAEPRPQACTMEYIPVCGHLFGGERRTYPNACAACADPDVLGRHPGACRETEAEEGDPSDQGTR